VTLDEEAMAVEADATQQPQALLERSLEKLRITGCMGELGAPRSGRRWRWRTRGMVHTEIAGARVRLGTSRTWVRGGGGQAQGLPGSGARAPGFARMNYLLPERLAPSRARVRARHARGSGAPALRAAAAP